VSETISEIPGAVTTTPYSRRLAFGAILSALLLTALDQNIVGNVLPAS